VAFLLTALYASPASAATTLVTPDGKLRPQPYQSWVDRAKVPTPPGTVTLHLAPCPAGPDWAAGCAIASQRAIYLGPDARDRGRFLHELGHIFDGHVMKDAWRARFTSVIGRVDAWESVQPDPPEEQFAEAYSVCARHSTLREMYFGMYAYSPTPARHRRACAVVRQAAGLPAASTRRASTAKRRR
jgi:hypothetical protein